MSTSAAASPSRAGVVEVRQTGDVLRAARRSSAVRVAEANGTYVSQPPSSRTTRVPSATSSRHRGAERAAVLRPRPRPRVGAPAGRTGTRRSGRAGAGSSRRRARRGSRTRARTRSPVARAARRCARPRGRRPGARRSTPIVASDAVVVGGVEDDLGRAACRQRDEPGRAASAPSRSIGSPGANGGQRFANARTVYGSGASSPPTQNGQPRAGSRRARGSGGPGGRRRSRPTPG